MAILRRVALASAAAALALAVSVGSVAAEKPTRGCSDNFALTTILGFRDYMNSAEFYASLPAAGQALAPDILAIVNSDAWLAGIGVIDANGDGKLCLKQKTITSGHLWGWLWNGVDNTKNP
jgi:hypothetical protein